VVKQGDLLAVVDPRPYEVALQNANGTLAKDEALLKNAQIDLQRYKTLVAQDSIARQQYDTQAALVRQYEAQLVTDHAVVDNAKLNLVYTRIIAPVSGRIGLRLVDKGNYITMGDATGICVITQMQPISVMFTIAEDTLPQVRNACARATRNHRARPRRRSSSASASSPPRQPDRYHDRHGEDARHLRQSRRGAVSQSVRQYPPAGRYGEGRHHRACCRHPARPTRFVYLKADDTVAIRVVETAETDGDKIAITKGLEVAPGRDRWRRPPAR
jgi:multidrug efflux system membrane fusion protein